MENEQSHNENEKTFTQAELDAIVESRVKREREKMPNESELTAFRDWKKSQQTEREKMDTITKERDEANKALADANEKLTRFEHERFLLGKGVPADDVDYYDYKISKSVDEKTSFEQAAETFLKDNAPSKTRFDTSASVGGGKKESSANDAMNSLIRGIRK